MGTCTSTQNNRLLQLGNKPSRKPGKKPVSQVVKVINVDGKVTEFSPPICVAQILFYNPDSFLCRLDSMVIDEYPIHVPEPEELKPGHLYFVLPNSHAQKPLSLDDLCELAIKASSNITIDDLQLSFRHCVV